MTFVFGIANRPRDSSGKNPHHRLAIRGEHGAAGGAAQLRVRVDAEAA